MPKNYYIKNFVLVDTPVDFIPGPDILATSTKLADIIQYLIDNGLIASLKFVDVNILTTTDTVVKARYAGVQPTATVAGSNEETVTITIPDGCTPVSFKVEGKPANTDSSDRRVVVFTGAGVPGNTSTADMMIPGIIKAALTTSIGGPSTDIPWEVQFGAAGDVDIIGVGTSSTPSLSLRLNNLNTLTDRHLLQFLW